VGDTWFKFNRFALIILLDDVISNIFKKIILLLFFGGVMELLPFCSNFILNLLDASQALAFVGQSDLAGRIYPESNWHC
jgi:hypothetical protein